MAGWESFPLDCVTAWGRVPGDARVINSVPIAQIDTLKAPHVEPSPSGQARAAPAAVS
ncbi:MAG: hypothetical protein OXU61_03180 [Gammaproteobacteria bacterium]|nr:hypothetical protein [Gammaproteobacteria bacterium]